MKKLFTILALSLLPAAALAQAAPKVSLNNGTFQWVWSQGTGGAADNFRMRCGTTTGVYSLPIFLVAPTLRTQAIQPVVVNPGTYFCVVDAINGFGVSSASNEVTFQAGLSPAAPSTLTVQ